MSPTQSAADRTEVGPLQASTLGPVQTSAPNVKRWHDGDMRKRWTAAGMLVAEQQFRRIIGYKDLAKLVIAIERHALLVAENNRDHQGTRQPVTV